MRPSLLLPIAVVVAAAIATFAVRPPRREAETLVEAEGSVAYWLTASGA